MTQAKPKKRLSFKWKVILALGAVLLIALTTTLGIFYIRFFGGNVTGKSDYLYISTGSNFETVMDSLKKNEILRDTTSFRWAAENMDYLNIKPGKYRVKRGMSNRTLINMLKSGNQEPVNVSFRNIRLKRQFAGKVTKELEADSLSFIKLLDSVEFVEKHGFDTNNVYTMFIPDSYQMYWNTSAEQLFDRLKKEYDRFWTAERRQKAEAVGLTPIKVSILAAIVDAEALHDDEMPTIAGLYLNRLNRGIKLQADPTVIFANQDFTIRRVLNRHLRKDNPYNTYVYRGLPPGPINMPSKNAIDAVLNPVKHNYLFMCAKEDFSGYHRFATNITEHMVNARKFQKALDERNIKR